MAKRLNTQRFFRKLRQQCRRDRVFGPFLQLMRGFVQLALAVAVFGVAPFAWILRDPAGEETPSTGLAAVVRMFHWCHWGVVTSTLLLAMIVLIQLNRRDPAARSNRIARRSPRSPPTMDDPPASSEDFIQW